MIEQNSTLDVVADNLGNDLFARLISEHNINIVYDASLKTACADPSTNTVYFPFWRVSKLTALHLRAHEVAHILYTPFKDFHNAKVTSHPIIVAAGIKNEGMMRSYINILEDIRIENLMSQQYAGFARIFLLSHDWLLNAGFYKKDKEQVELLGAEWGDRTINKILIIARHGYAFAAKHFNITQYDSETFSRANANKTFDEVVKMACELFILHEKDDSVKEKIKDNLKEHLATGDMSKDMREMLEDLLDQAEVQQSQKPDDHKPKKDKKPSSDSAENDKQPDLDTEVDVGSGPDKAQDEEVNDNSTSGESNEEASEKATESDERMVDDSSESRNTDNTAGTESENNSGNNATDSSDSKQQEPVEPQGNDTEPAYSNVEDNLSKSVVSCGNIATLDVLPVKASQYFDSARSRFYF